MSAVQLDQRLADTIQRLLSRYALPADCLIIEVTENAMMRNPSAQEVFTALKRIGVRLAVDDYGRGHSSLDCLLRLPLDIPKLDRIFVAEGIEDAEAHRLLVELGCDHFQGFHLGRPAPASAPACTS